ncbi:TPA: gp58-like family protein [Streptococcus suis]
MQSQKANQVDLQTVRETVNLYERIIGSTETGIKDKVARMVMTDSLFLTEVKDKISGTATQVSQLNNSYAIKNLTSAGTVLNQINLLANGTNRIDGRLTHITGQTLIDNGVIKNAMIGELDAGKITSGTVDAARIKANSIDGSKIAFDEAFFNGLSANQAYLKKLFAKDAFLTAVQAVTLSASKIAGGVLEATNGAVRFDLNNANLAFNQNATINFNSDNNALVRKKGDVTAFINFADDPVSGGVYAGIGVTSHAVGVTTANNSDRGKFAGMRMYRPNDTLDLVRLIGDTITLAYGTEGRYFSFKPSQLRNNVDMLKLAGAVYTLSRIFMHLSANGWAFDHPNFIKGVKEEMARNWLQDFANEGLPR